MSQTSRAWNSHVYAPVFVGVLFVTVCGIALGSMEQGGLRRTAGAIGGPQQNQIAYARMDTEIGHSGDTATDDAALSVAPETLFGWPQLTEPVDALSSNIADIAHADSIMTYEVVPGDTIPLLAQKFGISENTIIWVNDIRNNAVTPGDRLLILPISGILHQVKPQETLETIAGLYNISPDRIRAANHFSDQEQVFSGEDLIIPGGDTQQQLVFTIATGTPQISSGRFFKIPTTGWNWGKVHFNNAVDIANACGTPVYASAAGFVTRAMTQGWNDGYGGFIAIDHGNGMETVYAHLSAQFVSSGAYVDAGELIGAIGNTGRVDGVSGCHLHFEVHGAPNPFGQ